MESKSCQYILYSVKLNIIQKDAYRDPLMLFYKVLMLFWGCTRTCSHAWWFENRIVFHINYIITMPLWCVSVKMCIYLFFAFIICLCIYFISRSPEMLCFQALCQIICLFMYLYYFQKSRNVMFSGTVSDYLFIYVFILFPEVQKCYVFWHCARWFVYLCISIISRSPEMLCFLALCQMICLFMYFYYFYVFRHCARLLVYLCISIISRSPEMLCFQALSQIIFLFVYFYYFQKSRNVMFSGTKPDYFFICVFLLFPEVQKYYVFRHWAR